MKRIASVILLWLMLASHSAASDEGGIAAYSGFPPQLELGAWEAGLSIGTGWGYKVGRSNPELEDVELFVVAPRVGVGISEPLFAEKWFAASFQLFLEASYLREFEPKHGHAGGLAVVPRLNWLALAKSTSLVPFADLGLGLIGLDFDLEDQSDGFNFIVQVGVGVRWLVGTNSALALQWQGHHISNAASNPPNHGINTHIVSATYSRFF